MTTITSTVEQLTDTADRIRGSRPELGIHITAHIAGVVVEVTCQAHATCGHCGQPIATTNPGPVDWIDGRDGSVQGAFRHQHSCGQWNTPESASIDLHADNDTIDAEQTITALIADVDTAVRDARSSAAPRQIADLRAQLTAAINQLAAGAEDCEVLTGTETTPGVIRDGELVAWDYTADGCSVEVAESDLTATR